MAKKERYSQYSSDEKRRIVDSFENVDFDSLNSIMELTLKLCETGYKAEIRKGYILPAEEILSYLFVYTDTKYTKRIKFLSWLANEYYKEETKKKLEYAIEVELYEYAATLRDTVLVIEMPLDRG